MTFGMTIREARLRLGLTLDDVARMVKSHKGYISGIENGKVNPPSPKITTRLARGLGFNVETLILLGWVEKAPPQIQAHVRRVLG